MPLRVRLIHRCDLYSNKYGTSVVLSATTEEGTTRPLCDFDVDSPSLHGSVQEHLLDVLSSEFFLEPGINTSLLVDQLEELHFSHLCKFSVLV